MNIISKNVITGYEIPIGVIYGQEDKNRTGQPAAYILKEGFRFYFQTENGYIGVLPYPILESSKELLEQMRAKTFLNKKVKITVEFLD